MAKGLVLVVAAVLALHSIASNVDNEDSILFVAKGKTSNVPAGVSKKSAKKITMVIDTLQDILQSVESEEKQDGRLYQKYISWCQKQKTDVSQDLADAQKSLGDAKVQSQEQQSSIETLKSIIVNNEKDITETQDAMDQATALREDDNEKYNDDLQLNTQSLRQVNAAIKHVGKVQSQGGFLQNGVMKKLQLNQPGESSYVLGIMKGLKDKLQKSREYIMKVEKDKVAMHDSFMATKSASLKSVKSSTSEKKISLTETEAKETGTQQSMGKLTDEVASLRTSQTKTEDVCHEADKQWIDRQDDRKKEKAAISEAIRFLKAMALEQIALAQRRSEPVEQPLVSIPSFLQTGSESQASDRNNDLDAAQDSSSGDLERHMRKGTFDEVKNVVTKLIASHENTQDEESKKRKYCKTEIDSTQDEKTQTNANLATTKATIDKKQSEADLLDEEVKKLYASMDESRKSVEDAGKVRKQEEDAYRVASKDRSLAIKVLMQAKTVLQSFYDKNTLLQSRADPIPPEKWKSTRKTVASNGAASMIQNIADDITKEQKDATIRERQAIHEFEALQVDAKAENEKKQQDITDRVTTRAKLNVQINSLKEALTEQSDTLKSLTSQLVSLHKQCDELLKNYDNRKNGRTFEVSQLRDVMDVLSGSSIAPRTGALIQESRTEEVDAEEEEAEKQGGSDEESDAPVKMEKAKESTSSEEDSVSAREAALLRALSP